jgi:CubicO group peptidase (beta-lactamase class C family)
LKKNVRSTARIIIAVCILILFYGIYYCWISFPVATGYSSKVLCSALFVSNRDQQTVIAEDLGFTPMQLVNFEVDKVKRSVTASIWGTARRKAIFRPGCGCTILNGVSEEELRSQRWATVAAPEKNTDTLVWPLGDRVTALIPSNIDSTNLVSAVDHVFADTLGEGANITRALIILYDGKIIAERYGKGISRDTRLTGWSMTKSITGAMVGIVTSEKSINIDQRAPVNEWNKRTDPRRAISIKHLLQQTSGLDFDEVYSKRAHATSMLFLEKDAAAFAASRPLLNSPGTRFSYSSGNTNILSRICRVWLGDSAYQQYPYLKLFHRIGMYSALLEPDASGTFVGSSYCYATARDWARFGLLFADTGRFAGEQIIPRDYVLASVQATPVSPRGEYGFQWWLNRGAAGDETQRKYPDLPADMYYADGYEGQNIFIIPSKKLVIVRLGLTRAKHWGEVELIKEVMTAVR